MDAVDSYRQNDIRLSKLRRMIPSNTRTMSDGPLPSSGRLVTPLGVVVGLVEVDVGVAVIRILAWPFSLAASVNSDDAS